MHDAAARKAEEVLSLLGIDSLPIDPFWIVAEEGIELAPSTYGPKFDARIEFSKEINNFILFYKDVGTGRSAGRVRFSVSHELGHFYLPHHRERLERGLAHNSVSNFGSVDPTEREADTFAVSLLMPSRQFIAAIRKHRAGTCTLAELSTLAEEQFGTSLLSTVIRYCELDIEPSAIVVSERRRVKWFKYSYGMRSLGMGYVAVKTPVPPPSVTAKIWDDIEAGGMPPLESFAVDASIWYERPYRRFLWEESMPLGRTGLVLTYLTLADPE